MKLRISMDNIKFWFDIQNVDTKFEKLNLKFGILI